MALQHLRSNTASKRPTPASMADGQLAINTNATSPGVFFKDAGGALIKIGPVHVGTSAPNSSPAAGGSTGNAVGEQWLDTSGGNYVFKIWDGSAWRSEAGEFVDAAGDTMTGALILPDGTAAAPALGVGSTDNGIYSPGADQVALATNGTGRLFVDSSGKVSISSQNSATIPLRIYSSSNAGDAIEFVGRTANGKNQLTFYAANGTTEQVQLTSADSGLLIRNMLNTYTSFWTNDTERLRITSDGKVGIGTTSPSTKLHIADASAPEFRIVDTTNNCTGFMRPVDSSVRFGTGSNHPLEFHVNSSERARIDSSGRLGLGTSSPGSLFHIAKSEGSNYDGSAADAQANLGATLQINNTSAINNRFSQILFNSRGGTALSRIVSAGSTTGNSYFAFVTEEAGVLSEKMRLHPSGNLGIGLTSDVTDASIALAGGVGDTKKINFAMSGNSASIGSSHSGVSNGVGNIGLFARNGSAEIEVLRATGQGRVGIGTTSPGQLLSLSSTTPRIQITDTDTGVDHILDGSSGIGNFTIKVDENAEGSSPNFIVNVATSERLRITSDGKLGLGTSSPGALLDVENLLGSAAIILRGGSAGRDRWRFIADDTGTLGTLTLDNWAGGTFNSKLVIDSSGNVGIGTTSPDALLNLESGSSASLRIKNTTNNSPAVPYIELLNDNNEGLDIIINRSGSDSRAKFIADTEISVETGGSERVRIDSSGRLGLGTSSPSKKLQVDSADFDTALFKRTNSTGSATIFLSNTSNHGAAIQSLGNGAGGLALFTQTSDVITERLRITSTGALNFVGAGTAGSTQAVSFSSSAPVNSLVIKSDGKVGVGTSAPSQQLHIKNASDAVVVIESVGTASGDDARLEMTTTSGTFEIQNDRSLGTSGVLTFRGNTSNNLCIDHDTGRVGIGTPSPTQPLDVVGGFIKNDTGMLLPTARYGGGTGGPYISTNGTDNPIRFVGTTTNTERARIDNSGRVGIGTSSPLASIHHAVSDPQVRLQRTGAYSTSSGPLIQFQGKGPNGTNYNFGKIQAVSSGSNNAGELQFFTNIAGSQSERMRIDSSGRLGIGSTTPQSLLHVNGTGDVAIQITNGTTGATATDGSQITVEDPSADLVIRNRESANIRLFTANTERARIDSSGRLLVGTTTAPDSETFAVDGSAAIENLNGSTVVTVNQNATTTITYNLRSKETGMMFISYAPSSTQTNWGSSGDGLYLSIYFGNLANTRANVITHDSGRASTARDGAISVSTSGKSVIISKTAGSAANGGDLSVGIVSGHRIKQPVVT